MSKQYKPNIVRGGIAVPLGNNYFFMKGRKHKQGGIDVGKDLEVEDGEVMKLTKDNIKVFSAVPFLNGQSPVEKLLGGEDPNKVFAQQERFKKVNKINDDGTKAQLGKGKKITTIEIPESQQYAVTTPDGQRKVFNSKQEASDYVTANTPKGYCLYYTTNYGTNIDKGQTAILNRNTEREIEKATKQEELAKARLATIQQNKEASKEMLSYMPVIGDGMDLYQLGKDAYNGNYLNAGIGLGLLALPNVIEKPIKYVGKSIKKLFTKQPNWDNIIKQIPKLESISFPKEKTYIPDQIDSEASKRLNDFWNNIFMGKYASNRDRVNKNKVFRESIPGEFTSIKSTDPEAIKGAAGHSALGNAYIYSDINPINKDEIVIHEGAHNFRDTDKASLRARILNEGKNESLLHNIETSNYTKDEINNLMNAYNFTDEYRFNVLKNDARSELAEKAATNTQLQYHLYNKYGVKSIDELNKVIDNLTDDDLLYDLMQTNGYGVNFVKDIATLSPQVKKERVEAIRQALKYVPATIGVTTGLSLLSNNDQNVKRFGGKINKFRNGGDVTPEEEALWKANNTVKPASNYHAAKDMYITKTREDFTDFVQRNFPNCPTGLSNCTLTASQFYGKPIGRAHTIVTNPKENNLYPVNEEHAIPGTMVIASDPLGNINPKYHTMILSGYADKDYPFEYNGIKYNIKKGEPLVHYSKGKNNKESYKKNIPLRVYNDQSEGKTYNRYYRPYDKNGLPNVLLPELIVTNKKVMGGNHKLNTNQMANIYQVDSNGKTTWGMNFSTGGKSKGRQKALYGMKQRKVNWSDPSPEDYRTMVATNPPIEMIYDPSVDETKYYGRNLPEVSVTRDIRVAPTNTSVDEMDVNRTITRKAKQPRKYYKSVVDPNIDPLNPTKDDYHYMTYGKRNDKNNVKPGPTFNNTVDARDVNREIPKTYVSTKSNSTKSTSPKLRRKYWDTLSTYEDRPDNQVKSNKTNVVTPNTIKSTTNNKSVNYSVTNKKQTTPKQTTPNTSATKTTPKSNVTNNTSNITTPNNVTRTAPIAKSTSQEIPIFGLDAQNAFKKSIVGSKSNPDYIRGTFDFRDNKELVNKVDPNTIKVDSTNIRYKGAPSNGNYFKNYNAGDYISLGANVLGNIGSALINKHTLDNMEYASAPVPKMAIKQKTNFNINPQLDLSRERLREGVSDINTNTASSSTAINRNNKLRLANIMNTNQLYGTKENMETQLINADRMNQQNVFNSNIDAFNTWNKEKNIFETAKQEKYGENKVGAVQGISQAVHDFINNNEKRRQFNNSLISIMAANPNVNPEYLKTLGADWITNEHIRNWKLANNYKV